MAVGAIGATNITRIETVYDGRRARRRARGRRPAPRASHRPARRRCASCIRSSAPALVVHRTDLPGQEPGAAFLFVGRRGHILAAERERRRSDAGDLAHQPGANQPRQTPADEEHDTSAYHGLRGMMDDDPWQIPARSNFSCCLRSLCVPAAARARRITSTPGASSPRQPTTDWSWTTDANVIFGYNYQQRLFADFWAWESQNWVMLSGDTQRSAPGRLTVIGHALARAVDDRPARLREGRQRQSAAPVRVQRRSASACRSADRRRSSRPARATSARRSSTISIRTICSWGSARRIGSTAAG